MPPLRIFVADDARPTPSPLSDCLALDSDLAVVGTALMSSSVADEVHSLRPDLVILAVRSDMTTALKFLAVLRRDFRSLPVIFFSPLTARGAVATVDALSLGASDYVTTSATEATSLKQVRHELIPKIKALCRPGGTNQPGLAARSGVSNSEMLAKSHRQPGGGVGILAIGTSTGGPNALAELLARLAQPIPVPIVIVQHMPEMFTRLLADRLSNACRFPVREAAGGDHLHPGTAWIAPGGYHLEVDDADGVVRTRLDQGPAENSCRPAVDVLFRSVARVYGTRSLAVVLTGMGQDGLLGSEAIFEAGGSILAQDEASSVIWGMPGAVAGAGYAEKVLPLSEIAPEIDRMVRSPRLPHPIRKKA